MYTNGVRVISAAGLLFLLLILGCGGSGGGAPIHNSITIIPGSSWLTICGNATIEFPDGTFTNATTVTMTGDAPPRLTDRHFHPIEPTLTFSAPAPALKAFDVSYPDFGRYTQLEAVVLNGSQIVATLPVIRPGGQVGIHVDPALIPGGTGNLQVTICLGAVYP